MTDYPWKPNELHDLVEGLPFPKGLEWRDGVCGSTRRGDWEPMRETTAMHEYFSMIQDDLAKLYSGPTSLHILVKRWKASRYAQS